MLESVNNRFQYQKLSEEEMRKRKILGTLVGPCADIINPTRNGRKYSEKLWETVFSSPLVQEQFKAGAIFGELEHPDYDTVNPEKIAIAMPEPPKKGKDGLLYGYWHILDTPCGKILKTLVDYGYKPGISTRGNGDIIEDYNGEESVDPNTYQLNALDVVLIPAVEKARLNLVTESLQQKKTLNESLQELISKSNDDEKKTMNEALALLNISITSGDTEEDNKNESAVVVDVTSDGDNITISQPQEQDINLDEIKTEVTVTPEIANDIVNTVESSEADDNIDAGQEEQAKAVDDGSDIFVDLHEALNQIEKLNKQNEELISSLSVGHAKEQELSEKIKVYKQKIAQLIEETKQIKGLTARSQKIEESKNAISESLEKQKQNNASLVRIINLQKTNIGQLDKLNERNSQKVENYKNLLSKSENRYHALNEEYQNKIHILEEQLNSVKTSNDESMAQLKEKYEKQVQEIQDENQQLKTRNADYKNKLVKMTEAYINSTCEMYDIDSKQVINNVKRFSKEEVDRITESFANKKLSTSKLNIKLPSVKRINYSGNRDQLFYRPSNNGDDIDINEINNY